MYEHKICNVRTQGRHCGWDVLPLRPFRAFLDCLWPAEFSVT